MTHPAPGLSKLHYLTGAVIHSGCFDLSAYCVLSFTKIIRCLELGFSFYLFYTASGTAGPQSLTEPCGLCSSANNKHSDAVHTGRYQKQCLLEGTSEE